MTNANRYFNKLLTPKYLFLIIFIMLIIIHKNNLNSPPYGDALEATFKTAIWLKQNSFNYFALLKEPKFYQGGVNVHPHNIISFIAAIGYKFLSPEQTFQIIHFIMILCSSYIVVIYHKIAKNYLSPAISLLTILTALFEPVFMGQVSALYLEIPLALALALCLQCLLQKKYLKCAITGLVAYFFIKISFILILCNLIIFYVFNIIYSKIHKKSYSNTIHFLTIPFIIAIIHYIITYDKGSTIYTNWSFFYKIKLHFFYFIPSLLFSLISIVIFSFIFFIKPKSSKKIRQNNDIFIIFYFSILIISFWSAYLIFSWPLPRYATFIIFPQIILLMIFIKLNISRFSFLIIMILCSYNIANMNGLLLPSIPPNFCRIGAFLERSCEFNKDIESYKKLSSFLEKNYFNSHIVARPYLKYILTDPLLGYTKKHFPNVEIYNQNTDYSKMFNTIFIYVPFQKLIKSLHPSFDDIWLYRDFSIPGIPVIVYKKQMNK